MQRLKIAIRVLLLAAAMIATTVAFQPTQVNADHCGKYCPGGTEECIGPHGQPCGHPGEIEVE